MLHIQKKKQKKNPFWYLGASCFSIGFVISKKNIYIADDNQMNIQVLFHFKSQVLSENKIEMLIDNNNNR